MIRLLIGVIFIFGVLGGLFYIQHPEEFKEKVTEGIDLVAQKIKETQNKSSDISLPEIPMLKNNPIELSKSHLKKNIKTFTEDQMGRSHYVFIHSLYNEVLNREPSSEEEEKWLNALLQGASRDAVYRGVTLATDFLEKEYSDNQPEVGNDFLSFSKYFLKTYLNLELNEEKAKTWGNIRLSKYVVSKSLDLIDYYAATDIDALCKWYAVVSSDLATKFKIFDPKDEQIRTVESKNVHYKWAKEVPNDFIKSEIIIKLHKIFNKF